MRVGKWLAGLLALLFLALPLVGCSTPSTDQIFRYDLSGPIDNLDPQYADTQDAALILSNLYEGLVGQHPDGTLYPLAAESWEVSADGLTYRFTLPDDNVWARPHGQDRDIKEVPVTADDFVFAFERIFQVGSQSPYQKEFSALRGATALLDGTGSLSGFGVQAEGPYQLVFLLETQDPLFLERLSMPGAYPCNREFFYEAKGRYGLELSLILGNGPFRAYQWDNEEYFTIRPNERYTTKEPISAGGVNFFIHREDPMKMFLSGKADVMKVGRDEEELLEKAENILSSPEIMWGIVVNTKDEHWGFPMLREALAYTMDYAALEGMMEEPYQLSKQLVPEATRLGEQPLGEYLEDFPFFFDPAKGKERFEFSLESFQLQRLPSVVMYVPEDTFHQEAMLALQKSWQEHLSLYVNIKPVPQEELERRQVSGEFQLMLLPFTASTNRPQDMLSQFAKATPYQHENQVVLEFIQQAIQSQTLEEMGAYYQYAHNTILSDVQVIPVYSQPVHYVLGKGVSGLEVFSFGSQIQFKNGMKP